jgi:hypothetical protein
MNRKQHTGQEYLAKACPFNCVCFVAVVLARAEDRQGIVPVVRGHQIVYWAMTSRLADNQGPFWLRCWFRFRFVCGRRLPCSWV